MPSLQTILGWILSGLVQLLLHWLPVLRTRPVGYDMPYQWFYYNTAGDWFYHIDNETRPDEFWCHQWLEMAFGELRRLAVAEAQEIIDRVRVTLVALIGRVRSEYPSLGAWLNSVWEAMGRYIPAWAGTVRGGLNWLRDRLPGSIRSGFDTWAGYIRGFVSVVYSWAQNRYDRFRDWATDARNWISGVGRRLDDWANSVRAWIEHVRSDPVGYVVGLLGAAWAWLQNVRADSVAWVVGLLGDDWAQLVQFRRRALQFYLNLWSRGAVVLGALVSDPLDFLLTRLEQAVMDRW